MKLKKMSTNICDDSSDIDDSSDDNTHNPDNTHLHYDTYYISDDDSELDYSDNDLDVSDKCRQKPRKRKASKPLRRSTRLAKKQRFVGYVSPIQTQRTRKFPTKEGEQSQLKQKPPANFKSAVLNSSAEPDQDMSELSLGPPCEQETNTPRNSPVDFESVIKPIICNTIQEIADDRYRIGMKDKKWKKGLTARDIIKCQPRFDEMISKIYHTPSVSDILLSDIPASDQHDLIEQVYILNEIPTDTQEYAMLRKNIVNKFAHFKNLDAKFNMRDAAKIESKLNVSCPIPLKYRILTSNMPEKNKKIVYEKYLLYSQMRPGNDTRSKLSKLLNTYLNLPTENVPLKFGGPDVSAFLKEAQRKLNQEIFGMEKAKEEILAALAMRIKNPRGGEIIAFSGPPGVGKTSIIQTLGFVTGMPISHISIGGMRKANAINGNLYVWEGSGPGEIVNSLIQMKCLNGIISLDEIDKVPVDCAIDISGALNYVLDFTQNDKFHDNYLTNGFDIDLSNIWFVATLNNPEYLPAPLLNRLKIIKIDGYSAKEKMQMAKKYIIPKMLKEAKLTDSISFSDKALQCIAGPDKDRGVRKMKNKLSEIIKKVNLYAALGQAEIKYPIVITEKIIHKFCAVEKKEQLPDFYT